MTTTKRIACVAGVVTGFFAMGCVELPTDEVAQEFGVPCPTGACNSPVIDSIEFHELNVAGATNDSGFSVVGFDNGGLLYRVNVIKAQLSASRPGFPTLKGATGPDSLVGASKALVVKNSTTGGTYRLKIEDVVPIPYWTVGGMTESYRVTWTKVGGDTQAHNVCPDPPGDNVETLGVGMLDMVMFEGDRIDGKSVTVAQTAETSADARRWFNLGCAGHALSKLHMTHHSYASKEPGLESTPRERTAILKMFVADYCGDGTAWTIQGQPLGWIDSNSWFSYLWPGPLTIEARWTEKGASCLETPRLQGVVNPYFPLDIYADIVASCGASTPPPCSASAAGTDITLFDGAHMVTANP